MPNHLQRLLLLVLLPACGAPVEGRGLPSDGRTVDSGDTGARDTADGGDSGVSDTGPVDTGDSDTGTPDTGVPDTGTPDTGSPDSGPPTPTSMDLHEAILSDNPADLADWPVTTSLTRVQFSDDGVHVEFSKQDGDGRWPDVTPADWDGPLQYTLGLAEYIDGQWYASAAIQYWYGLYASGGNVALDNQIAVNWYYDGRWGALQGRQPATGELVGVFIVAGNVRGVTDGSQSPVRERSNVVVVPFPDVTGADYSF